MCGYSSLLFGIWSIIAQEVGNLLSKASQVHSRLLWLLQQETLWFSSISQGMYLWDFLSTIFHLHHVEKFKRKSTYQCKIKKFDQTSSLGLGKVDQSTTLSYFIIWIFFQNTLIFILYNLMLSAKSRLEWKMPNEAKIL